MKGLSILIFGGIILISLLGIYFLGSAIAPSRFVGLRNPLVILWDALTHIPVSDVIDFLVAGTFGIILFAGDWVLRPFSEFTMSLLLGKPVVLPEILGYVEFLFLLALFMWRSWGSLWSLVADNLMRFILIISIIFAIGIALLYIGAIQV